MRKIKTFISKFIVVTLSSFCFFGPSLCFAETNDYASLDSDIEKVTTVIKSHILKHIITIAAICGFILCAISAAGGNVGQIALNNLGYVLFLVFGSAAVINFVEKFNNF